MQIEMLPIESIREYDKNPRNNKAAVGPVAASIKTYGFRVPVIVDGENVLIAGHTRVLAAKQLEMTEVPAVRANDLTPEQIRAFRIADNKLHEFASWDLDLLTTELSELKLLDVDLASLGFNDDELSKLLQADLIEGLCDPDEIPLPPDEATAQPGDLWLLGNHRLYCGDSSNSADLDRLLDGASIHLVNTDPPYNVNVEPRSNNARAAGSKALPAIAKKKAHLQSFDDARQGKPKPTNKKLRAKDRVLANDFMSDADFDKVLLAWFGNMSRALVPGGCFYIWGGFANWANYCQALDANGLYFAQGITWVKDHPVLGRKDFMNDCEHAWYGWKEGAGHKFYGPNNARNVWHVKKVNPQSMIHLTEKPVELAVRAIQYSSRTGENVLDLFGGSGSTLIGAEQTGRKAFLMELDPLYCDVIVQRYEKFSGKTAERVSARRDAPVLAEASEK
ncbi:MAG: ParB N-terminal domain-containing protein [Planctomycetes bacterium]|nr:ParB N-terminal domain-containing protein [Planctomycetota bacterium]